METCVRYRMELKLMKDGRVLLAIVKSDVYDEGLWSIGETLELLCVNCEKYVLHAETVEVARDETLLADRLDCGLVAYLADLAVQFKMLHCVEC